MTFLDARVPHVTTAGRPAPTRATHPSSNHRPALYAAVPSAYNPVMVQIGDWQIRSVINGYVRLDGGAMFGVVPKVLWARSQDVDDQNRILLATRTLLAINKRAGRILLADTGTGTKWSTEAADRYGIEFTPTAIDDALGEAGTTADDVTDVVVTHLHFDHAGGMTVWADQPGGPTRPRFAKARHWIHARQLAHAQNPTPRDRASFLPIDFEALIQNNLMIVVQEAAPECEIPGVRWWVADGHTPAQLLPWFHLPQGRGGLLFVGDVIPTADHLPLTWIMAYDLLPLTTLDERRKVLSWCRDDDLLIAFPHDRTRGIVSVTQDDRGRPRVDRVLG